MKFTPTPLEGAYLIALNPIGDERGFFARQFCAEEFQKQGIDPNIVQINTSTSAKRGTLRGLHYQIAPKEETKLVKCIKGEIYDLILDLRPDSPTFGKTFGTTLSENNRLMMYVPRGFAHGFLSLTDNTELIYFVSESYSKEHERGIRWNDPAFNISWPFEPVVISERDLSHPNFQEVFHEDFAYRS